MKESVRDIMSRCDYLDINKKEDPEEWSEIIEALEIKKKLEKFTLEIDTESHYDECSQDRVIPISWLLDKLQSILGDNK